MPRIAPALAAIAATLIVVGGASAHNARFDSTIEITDVEAHDGPPPEKFSGVVGSTRRACVRQRKVVLIYHYAGDRTVVAEDTSNRDGEWRIVYDAYGDYSAKVRRKRIVRSGHRHICRSARTPSQSILPG